MLNSLKKTVDFLVLRNVANRGALNYSFLVFIVQCLVLIVHPHSGELMVSDQLFSQFVLVKIQQTKLKIVDLASLVKVDLIK